MTFQQKVFESTADFRARATTLAGNAIEIARARATRAAQQVGVLKSSLATLAVAGSEFNKVARLHVSRFVKENSAIALAAGKDVGLLARATFAQLTEKPVASKRKSRKTVARKRVAKAKAA